MDSHLNFQEKLLEVKGLVKSFTSGRQNIHVLNRLNFAVFKGDFVCIVGPSGCGKSTLLTLLAGLEKPDSGQIYLKGQEVTKPDINRVVVFQDFNQLFPWRTVLENVLFPLTVHKIGASQEERISLAKTYLAKVKLEGYETYYPHQLSGGMKQRVAIARALALKSEILLMDEPFGSLDAQSRTELQELLTSIWKNKGPTIVFVTHDIAEALTLANRIVVMGKASGNIKAVYHNTLPWPRDPSTRRFGELYREIYQMLKT